MTDIKPCEAWAIVGPDGVPVCVSFAATETGAWHSYCGGDDAWQISLVSRGYTVQPVMVIVRKI